MSSLCGWVGPGTEAGDARGALVRMAAALTRSRPAKSDVEIGRRSGLAVAAGVQATSVQIDPDLVVGVEGSPAFSDSRLAELARDRGAAAALAAGFRERGPAILELLRGEFAVAVLRDDVAEALIAVDRLGGRFPLVYREVADGLVFGSTADAIRAHPRGWSDLDPQGLYNYVYFHKIPGAGTAWRGIRRILPGRAIHFENGAPKEIRYWRPDYREHERTPVPELEREFFSILRGSVSRATDRQSSGCFLSGGTDSSTVAGIAGEVTGRPARTYSIGFDVAGFNELEYARVAATHFGTEHHEYYLKPTDVLETIPKIAEGYSDPFGNESAVPTYCCARLAGADGIARLLAGDGGDELFGGNERYAQQRVFGIYDQIPVAFRRWLVEPLVFGFPAGERLWPVRKARSYIRQASLPMPQRLESYNPIERFGPSTIFEGEFLAQVDPGAPLELLQRFYADANAGSMLNRMLALDLQLTLADSDLPKVSRMCELAGLQVAYPLLSDEMVEFSFGLPPRLKLKGFKLRWFWKHALRSYLPQKVLTKKKHGFGLPFGVWLRDDPGLRERSRASLSGLKKRGIVRPEFIDRLLELHATEHATFYGVMIWVLMILEEWIEAHADRAIGAVRS